MIPETLFFNHESFLFKNDEKTGKIVIHDNPRTEDFIQLITSKASYEISSNETKAATVLRTASEHPCYMSVNLLNWR